MEGVYKLVFKLGHPFIHSTINIPKGTIENIPVKGLNLKLVNKLYPNFNSKDLNDLKKYFDYLTDNEKSNLSIADYLDIIKNGNFWSQYEPSLSIEIVK